MPCGIQLLTGLADSEIGQAEALALADPDATHIFKEATHDGLWNLTIVYPPCQDGTDPIVKSDKSAPPVVIGSALTSPNAFIQSHLQAARNVKSQFRVPVSVTISQSALETGWGRSVVGNAYFGIKAQPNKRSVAFVTHEVVNGQAVQMQSSFSAYNSFEEAAMDYGNFLNINPRYAPAFLHTDNPEAFAQAVAAAQFATDPNYGSKLIDIMRDNALEQYDRV